jgi:hypothetical protein
MDAVTTPSVVYARTKARSGYVAACTKLQKGKTKCYTQQERLSHGASWANLVCGYMGSAKQPRAHGNLLAGGQKTRGLRAPCSNVHLRWGSLRRHTFMVAEGPARFGPSSIAVQANELFDRQNIPPVKIPQFKAVAIEL